MSFLSRLASLRRNLFTRPRMERDLDDELRAYLDLLTEEKHGGRLGRGGSAAGSAGAVGICGLIASSVAQHTHEIRVRMALGAAQADVVRMVVRQGASLAAIGIVLGLGGAFALTRLLKTMLFGIGITDPLTFAAAPSRLMLVVLLATFLPAIRATRISPMVALRYE